MRVSSVERSALFDVCVRLSASSLVCVCVEPVEAVSSRLRLAT